MRNSLSVLLLTVAGAAAALGQTTPAQTVVMAAPQMGFIAMGAPMMAFGMTPVTGKPYSGEEVSESVQTLADGTRISQTMTLEKIYRDSQGRTRMERPLMHPGMGGPPVPPDAPTMIDITDPVAHLRYTLDTQGKIAHRWELPTPASTSAKGGGFAAMLSPSLPTVAASMTQVIPQTDPSRPHSQFEKLDPQTIDGIVVEGKRTTMTYPVGSVGNDREIVTTNEMWTSPELNVMVLSKNSDPRNGDHTQKLINISRDEPDASLFQLPADYEVSDEKGPVHFVSPSPVRR
ncbi:MAG TPA: hypothetical protein VGG97_01050 [Bryobacteraceae bacterium]